MAHLHVPVIYIYDLLFDSSLISDFGWLIRHNFRFVFLKFYKQILTTIFNFRK